VRSYHGQPVLKEPVWTWEIPTYFFTGGVAGASAGLAYLSELSGNELLARRAWGAACTAVSVSPVLLISDLGRPARFLNMMRLVKVTSPMSLGSWILAASGASTTLATANSWLGLFRRPARLARPAAALLGLPLCSYTGALLANTAVPAWHEARWLLPFVSASGASLSAGALALITTPTADAGPARRLALASAAAEVGLKELMERRLGELGEPYRRGPAARFGRIGKACILAGATLVARRGSSSRGASIAGGALLCAGAFSARWSVFKAGFASASDPKYVVGPQRAAIERRERPGAARRGPRAAQP
jgi:hypothetical protein